MCKYLDVSKILQNIQRLDHKLAFTLPENIRFELGL